MRNPARARADTAWLGDSVARRNGEISMKSSKFLVTLAAAAGTFAMVAPIAFAQSSEHSEMPPAVTASTAGQPVEAVARVRAALDQFDSALASHDVGELQAQGIKPKIAKRWQEFFRDNPRASVTDNCPAWALVISGDTAQWHCTETATIISEGKPVPFAHLISFTFTKKDQGWMISDRR